ncbi:hypothetical protein DITRI_Ditri19aG0120200 [Diplodiscus trichospermus]
MLRTVKRKRRSYRQLWIKHMAKEVLVVIRSSQVPCVTILTPSKPTLCSRSTVIIQRKRTRKELVTLAGRPMSSHK